MRPHWLNLKELDRAIFRTTVAFLSGRLEEQVTIDWALRLKSNDIAKRSALLELIDNPIGQRIREPWRSAWRLIEESWSYPTIEDHSSPEAYNVKQRLNTGDRSGSLVTAIVELVAPKLMIEPLPDLHPHFRKPPKRPKKVMDLFSTRLTSGEVIDSDVLKLLENLADGAFLISLALALDAAVANGLDIARRIGWDGEHHLWKLGQLYRIFNVTVSERSVARNEPDQFHRGIAPSVKLLHAVVARLVDIDLSRAHEFVCRWKLSDSPIHLRLWSALSRNPRVTPAKEVGDLLLSLDNRHFWNLHDFPEIAELRAIRFSEFDRVQQDAITTRIRKLPPRNQWPKKGDTNKIKNAQLYWSVRELQRIKSYGATLSQRDQTWLDSSIHEYQFLFPMSRLDEGFPSSPKAQLLPPNPDNRYDMLANEDRLKALEAALTLEGDDLFGRGTDWIKYQENCLKLLADFESTPNGGAAFPKVWEQFCWAHSPETGESENAAHHNVQSECAFVLSLLAKLPNETLLQAINGISYWLSTWKNQVVVLPEGLPVWLKLWPIAVEVTNANHAVEEEVNLNTVAQFPEKHEPLDLDTLNTPAGKLVSVFLATCPNLQENPHPFDLHGIPLRMRDTIFTATGRSGLIARHQMIESLTYFLRADPGWTNEHLITPLIADNSGAIALWRAIARQTHFSEVLKIIGGPMAERATDHRLGRETRSSLVFSLIIECLHAFREKRSPAVPYPRIQQMIRSLDDEVRAHGAETIQRFVKEISETGEEGQSPSSPAELFRSAAAPLLKEVWPQERSLATPGVSRALADLPATAQEAFVEAVNTIERFLVPLECWSMLDYGLYGDDDGTPKLSSIDSHEKATALLRLLDLTIGRTEESVVPHDLADALDQIRTVSAKLTEDRVFRRLATATRRG